MLARSPDYARLDASGQVYLDYTGGGLAGESQIREHANQLCEQVFAAQVGGGGTAAVLWVLFDEPYGLAASYLGWFVSLPLLVVLPVAL